MGRRRSGFSRPRSSSRSTRNTRTARAPPKQGSKPQAKSGGMFSGLMGTMFTGMAFGAGSEVAHTVVGNMMGKGQQEQAPQQAEQTQQTQQQNCSSENNRFVECLKLNSNSIQDCQIYLDMLKQCEKH